MSMQAAVDEVVDNPRRAFLVRALSLGWLAGGAGWQLDALAGVFGELPGKLPEGRSVFSIDGEVWVNGQRASRDTVIGPDDHVRTGDRSALVAVVGQDALILRANSELQLGAGRATRRFFRLVTGAMLSVFGRRDEPLEIRAPTVTIGIRGTGVYTEADAEKTYVCTCYGRTTLTATADPAASEDITSRHHDAPRWVLADPQDGRRIIPAAFQWHTDLELMTLEALVGRTVPFQLEEMNYRGPRRDY
ncbi:FecR domain-containing protein [Fontimonas sp. SYSU GA230001]|uniref:FecR domain-containing protein n=1 Tax=Fontimonas sp. SYSU GA230001 TaxID=3142450 RepID=UPI0032B5A40C